MAATLNNEDLDLIASIFQLSYLFEYKGSANNVFSIVTGSWIGTIDFYTTSRSDFISNATSPASSAHIGSLISNGTMTPGIDIGTDGEVLFFKLTSFNALEDVVINYYNDVNKSNVRLYIPSGISTVSSSDAYYPTVFGNMLRSMARLSSVGFLNDIMVNKNVFSLNDIDFDRIVQPIVVSQPSILASNIVRMNLYRDRTIDVQFDLHRDVTGDTIYFAMKSDKKSEFYDVEPILCVIDDAVNGLVSLTIPEDDTVNLRISKYYGELFRKTASGKFQTLITFDIDLLPEIISTRDV